MIDDKVVTGIVLFDSIAFNQSNSIVTATYDMPFAPDDYFAYVNNTRRLIRSNAAAAAKAFGELESALDVGHAYGQNIVTGWNEAPSLDLSPVYIQLAGIEGAFLMDSCSYAWGPDGMVVSSDLMLLGVSGWYGASQPSTSWLRLPVPISGLQQVSAPLTGSASKANSISIPGGFDPRSPDAVLAALPSNGSDSFALYRNEQIVIGPTLALEQFQLTTGPLLSVIEYPYALILEPEVTVMAAGPVAQLLELIYVNPPAAAVGIAGLAPVVNTGSGSVNSIRRVGGTASPVLGVYQVSPTSVATDAGWTLAYNSAADESSISVGPFGFNFVLGGVTYTSCYVTSNQYLTFGTNSVAYLGLGESTPSVPKLHFGAGDYSYQRVYTKAEGGIYRIRWEGHSDWFAGAGNSNRFVEVTFYAALSDGTQFLEVRTGGIASAGGQPFMLASSTTAYASGSLLSERSWVYEGNSDGSAWSLYVDQHVE